MTCATVGWSLSGRISAVEACNANALALAVEKTAVPLSNVADGVPLFASMETELAPHIQDNGRKSL